MAEKALSLTPEQIIETSLVDLAFMILKKSNQPHNFRDLMYEVARIKGLSEEQINDVIARLYTEINIDGRFICIGANVWGLKRWYPTDKAPEKVAGKKFTRKAAADDDEDFYGDDEDDSFEEDLEDEDFGDYADADTDEAEADDDDTDADDDDEDLDGDDEEFDGDDADGEDDEAEEDDLDGYEEDDDF